MTTAKENIVQKLSEAKSERSDKEIVFTAVLYLAEKGLKTLEVQKNTKALPLEHPSNFVGHSVYFCETL